MNIFEKLLGKLSLYLKFLNRDSSPSNKASVKNSTVGPIQQAGRDINIESTSNDVLSDLERKIVQKLYKEYRKDRKIYRWKVASAYKELKIKEGTYVGVLNDSKYIKLDGDELTLTNEGIRFMDHKMSQNSPKLDLWNNHMSVAGGPNGNFIMFQVENIGTQPAMNVRYFLAADDTRQTPLQQLTHRISPGESTAIVNYHYTGTDFFTKELHNIRLVFLWSDADGNEFISGRYLTQERRADGNFNLSATLGGYFEN